MKKDIGVTEMTIGVSPSKNVARNLSIRSVNTPAHPTLSEQISLGAKGSPFEQSYDHPQNSPTPRSPPDIEVILDPRLDTKYLIHSISIVVLDMTLIAFTLLFCKDNIIVLVVCIVLIAHVLSYLIPMIKRFKRRKR